MTKQAVQQFNRTVGLVNNANATRNRPAESQQSFLKAGAISREQHRHNFVSTALHLLPDLAGFVSGQIIVVDGGNIMYLHQRRHHGRDHPASLQLVDFFREG